MVLFFVTAIILFFRITHVDMTGDDAHYSVRAIGPVDFMFAEINAQSTPIQWFDKLPRWASLSFHDHPKPLFLVQHVFLSIRQNVFFAKLPYALFSLGTLVVMYFLVRKFKPEAAVVSSALLALNAHFIWAGRVAYLESGVMFFILLAVYYFIVYESNTKYWWKFGIALGLALSVKFTTLFLVPSILLLVIVRHRSWFRDIRFYGAFGIALVMQLPLIIYNVLMYQTTGHFSLQFVRLFHQSSPWHLSGVNSVTVGGLGELFISLGHLISWPLLVLFIAALAYTVWWKRRLTFFMSLVLFFTIQQFFIGRDGYMLSMYAIFIAPILGLAFIDVKNRLEILFNKKAQIIANGIALVVAIYLGIFVVNSHLMPVHYGVIGWAHSSSVSQNYGAAQLDRYLDDIVAKDHAITRLDPFGDIKIKDSNTAPFLLRVSQEKLTESVHNSNIIIFDERISWFSRVWLFERRRFYQNIAVFSVSETSILKQLTINSFYFIKAEEGAPIDSVTKNSSLASLMEEEVLKRGIKPDYIYRDDGKLAFKVYYVDQRIQK